jgi:hypothetical protein
MLAVSNFSRGRRLLCVTGRRSACHPRRPRSRSTLPRRRRTYWYRPTGSFHNAVNRSAVRWPGPAPYERGHLATTSQKASVSQLPEHMWSGFPRPDLGPVAELVAKRLRDEDVELQHRRLRALEHRASCHQRIASRQGERWALEGLAGASWGRPATASPALASPWTRDAKGA